MKTPYDEQYNEDLCKLESYSGKKCVLCGRAYPSTILDIEASVHHGKQVQCLNKQASLPPI